MIPTTVDRDTLIDCLRLIRTPTIGPVAFRHLVQRFGSPAEALHHLPPLLAKRGAAVCSPSQAEAELKAADRAGLTYVTWRDPAYPAPLAAIEDAPPLLLVKGNAAFLSAPCVAIVGARNASANGRKIAEALGADLAAAGWVVVSGMARGIDGAAHRGALRTGSTVAVLAGGTDVVYPREHAGLYEQIAAAGTVIAESPPGAEPQAAAFPRRNRIISGLSRGVVVVEATLRSGSLITARLAADQGRDVLAVPGSPLDPRAAGPNSLIRDGAVLVERAEDVLAHLANFSNSRPEVRSSLPDISQAPEKIHFLYDDTVRRKVEGALSPSPTGVDEVVRQCQVSAATVAMVLLDLELAGRLERHPGNRVALIAID